MWHFRRKIEDLSWPLRRKLRDMRYSFGSKLRRARYTPRFRRYGRSYRFKNAARSVGNRAFNILDTVGSVTAIPFIALDKFMGTIANMKLPKLSKSFFRFKNRQTHEPNFYDATGESSPEPEQPKVGPRIGVVREDGSVAPLIGSSKPGTSIQHTDLGVDLKPGANGRKSVLLKRGVVSFATGADLADLYVSFKGNKVIFSLIQAKANAKTVRRHIGSPRNVHLMVTPGGKNQIHVDEFSIINGAEPTQANGTPKPCYVYAKSKHTPAINEGRAISDFQRILTAAFGERTLANRSFEGRDSIDIHKALSRLEISAPGIMPIGR